MSLAFAVPVGVDGRNRPRCDIIRVAAAAGRLRAEMLSERLLDAERQREDVMQKLDIHKRTSARAEKDWELQRNNLHVCY